MLDYYGVSKISPQNIIDYANHVGSIKYTIKYTLLNILN